MQSPQDPLTGGLLPVVIHQLNNATQLLANFQALIQLGGAEELLQSRSGDLAETARTVHELGYVLAIIASAAGTNMLQERREEQGLGWMLSAVRDGVRREGCDMTVAPADLPGLSATMGEGWETPWAISSVLLVAATSSSSRECLEWSIQSSGDCWQLHLPSVALDDLGTLPLLVAERFAEASFQQAAAGLILSMPLACMIHSGECARDSEDQLAPEEATG